MQHMQRTTAPRVMFDTRRCSLDFTDGPMRDCEGRASTCASLQTACIRRLSGPAVANRQYRECRDDHDDTVGDFARRADFLDAHEQAQMRQLQRHRQS